MDQSASSIQKVRQALRLVPVPPRASPTPDPEMSRAMDRFMDSLIGYKCVERGFNVSQYRVQQAVWNNLYREGLKEHHKILTGSLFEGMPNEVCSDQDVMVNNRDFPVVVTPRTPAQNSETKQREEYAIPEGNPDQPAYLRLAVPDGMAFRSYRIKHTVTRHSGSTYLSSELMSGFGLGKEYEIHGPAHTTQLQAGGGFDRVICLKSPAWPVCAEEFFFRPRSHGWPPQSLLSLIKQAGCHVVGARHPSSQHGDLEWRWSCSVAEKHLIHNLDTEIACTMYVLKCLKRRLWPADKAMGMCSYYPKIACMWVAEIAPHQGSCMAYTRLVMDWLIQCYEKNELPHYFIKGQNLIGHLSQDTCKEVARKLHMVRSELWLQVLCSVEMDSGPKLAIKSITVQTGIPTADPLTEEEHRHILNSLFGCDKEKAVQVLEKAAQVVGPGSKAYVIKERYFKDIKLPGPVIDLYSLVEKQIGKTSLKELVTIPERILLPLIDNITSIISPSHVDMFRILLNTSLGDLYLYMIMHYKGSLDSTSAELVEMLFQRANQYYTECTHGSSSEGTALWAYVHLAKLCYLSGAEDVLEDNLVHLRPMLDEVELTSEGLDTFKIIVIRTKLDVCTVPWKGEELTYRRLLEAAGGDNVIYINPVVLGYFFLGRHSLRQDRRDLAEVYVGRMKQALDELYAGNRQSTKVFIKVLESDMKQ